MSEVPTTAEQKECADEGCWVPVGAAQKFDEKAAVLEFKVLSSFADEERRAKAAVLLQAWWRGCVSRLYHLPLVPEFLRSLQDESPPNFQT